MNNKSIGVVFCVLLSAILEKASWRIAGFRLSLYFLGGAVLVLYTLIHNKGKLVVLNEVKPLLKYRLFLILFSFLQIFTIKSDSECLSQYIKGVFELILFTTIFVSIYALILEHREYWSISHFLDIVCIIGAVNIVYNLLQLYNKDIDSQLVALIHSDVTRYGLDEYGHLGRLTGLFTDSNNNGSFLVMTMIFALYRLRTDEIVSKVYFVFLNLLSILSGVILLLTFSRTSWIGAFVFLLFYFIHFKLKTKMKLFLLAVLAMILLSHYYSTNEDFAAIIQERFKTVSISNINTDSHFPILVEALSIWSSSVVTLLFGTGVNCLSIYYQVYFNRPGYKAHNYYVQNLAEYGILGFIWVGLFLFQLFKMARASKNDNIKFFSTMLVVSIFCMNLSYDSMVQPFFYIIILAVIVGLLDSDTDRQPCACNMNDYS